MAHNQTILDRLEDTLGEDIILYENCVVFKPKGKKNAVPWHQDFISRKLEPTKYIVWIALDKANKENGCLKVIPGSHKIGFLPWHRVEGETHHDRVNKEFVDETKVEYVELEAGDALVFHMQLLHSSEEVHSDLPRRAFRVSYQGFNQIYSPRATPIVVRGGHPKFLREKFNVKREIIQQITDSSKMSNRKLNVDFVKFLQSNPFSMAAIFEASDGGKITYDLIQKYNSISNGKIEVKYFLDNQADKNGTFFLDKPIYTPDNLKIDGVDYIIIASSAHAEISSQLIDNLNIRKEKMIPTFLF